MAKNDRRPSRSDDDSQSGGFRFQISKTKVNKQKLMSILVQFPEAQYAHISHVADVNDTSNAELMRQALATCLESMGVPLPGPGDELSDEVRETMERIREKSEARAEKKAAKAK